MGNPCSRLPIDPKRLIPWAPGCRVFDGTLTLPASKVDAAGAKAVYETDNAIRKMLGQQEKKWKP